MYIYIVNCINRKTFFLDKICAYVERRQVFIQDNINASIQSKKEAEQLKEEYEQQLSTVHEQAQDILAQATLSAANTKKDV